MVASDRQKQIRQLLLEYKHVDVNSLCSFLLVSPATIRRDLDVLEKQGFLTKTYGGAVLNEDQEQEIFLKSSADPYLAEKKAVAALASNLIHEGESIFLGSGSICNLIAPQLKTVESINVVTNSISTFLEISKISGIQVILAGGQAFGTDELTETIGEIAKHTIASMYFDKVFFSVDGISFNHGLSMSSLQRLDIIRCALANSSEQILLTDTSKFGCSHLHSVGRLDSVKKIVTPIGTPDEYKAFFLEHQIAVYEASIF